MKEAREGGAREKASGKNEEWMRKVSIKKGFQAALDLNNALYGRDSQQNTGV